ncbi:protein-glutamate O-methyltransferase CheR [Reinekea sp.]|jgi:chemotaxis protein methyltransferase CheR|uniref:CheR family methyltransferase n=1 Tax=Reinekea sp. TaxID=1970455 RepID=UPI002A81ADA7|nr:protein-glutamate O-methyltransferase CheR [Reinekea sp.]
MVDTKPKDRVATPLHDKDFQRIQSFLYNHCGISMAPTKKTLVATRLLRRLRHYGLSSYGDYFALATKAGNGAELTLLIDSLTTNETYFFREVDHFHFVEQLLTREKRTTPWQVWSGASSSGEEVFSLAMTLADTLGLHNEWRVHGSDLSSKVLALANEGLYPMARNDGIGLARLKKYCLKGVGAQQGSFKIGSKLRRHVSFSQRNLMSPEPKGLSFDLIFLRNVLIYFNRQSKQQVINQVLDQLLPGGYFFISHTETLFGIKHGLEQIHSSVFRKP